MIPELQPTPPEWLVSENLGRIGYSEALETQRARHGAVLEDRGRGIASGALLLLQHDPPVVTVSRRAKAGKNVLASLNELARLGIDVVDTDRGGDVTYHGPGQLVAYPILDLNLLGLRIHGYIRLLEQAAIDTCAAFGVHAERDPEATGVWVGLGEPDGGRKIAAIGVRVSRWITLHGLSFNIAPDLAHYEAIVPCGLHGRGVTSLERELGAAAPRFDAAQAEFERCFRALAANPAPFRDRVPPRPRA
jgi:lipoate-protein ligase B